MSKYGSGVTVKKEQVALPVKTVYPPTKIEYSTSEQFRAAFEDFNSIGGISSIVNRALESQGFADAPDDFDPYDGTYDIRPGYEDNYIDVDSPDEIAAINRRIDREQQNAEILEITPLPIAIAAGIADPINFIPFLSGVSKAKTVMGTAGRFAAAGAASEAAIEGIMQEAQETRTLQESLLNIGMTTILSGGLGAVWRGASDINPGIDLKKIVRDSEEALKRPEGQSIGAARAGEIDPEMLEVANALGVNKAFAFQDPVMRLLHGPFTKGKELVGKLSEVNVMREGAARGEVAADIPVENWIKGWEANRYAFTKYLDESFVKYRNNEASGKYTQLNRAKYSILDSTVGPKDKLTKAQFNQEVTKAARREGQHHIPEVAEAAKNWRETVVRPLAEVAMNTKKKDGTPLLPPEIATKEDAERYVTRLYDQDVIKGRQQEFDKLNESYFREQRDAAAERVSEWNQLYLNAKQILKDTKADVRRSIGDAKSAIRKEQEKLVKLSRDERGIKQAVARAERNWTKANDRLEKFRPDDVKGDDKKIYSDLLKDLKRGKPKGETVSLSQFIRSKKGIKNPPPEMTSQDITKTTTGVINTKSGMTLDQIGEAAFEAGYYKERPSTADLTDDIINEINGHATVWRDVDYDILMERQYIDDLTSELEQAGISVSSIKDAAHLKKIIDNLPDTNVAYRMSTPAARAKFREIVYYERRAAEELRKLDEASIAIEESIINQAQIVRDAKLHGSAVASRANETRKEIRGQERSVQDIRKNLERDKYFGGMTDLDIADNAIRLRERILSLPAGRFDYDYKVGDNSGGSLYKKNMAGARGPLKGRAYNIDDLYEVDGIKFEDFLENDIEKVTASYIRSMASQTGLVRKFGSLDLEDEIQLLRDENERLKKLNPDQAAKLDKAQERAEKDILALRDRLVGTYNIPDDYAGFWARSTRIMKQLNYMRFLGGMTLSALPDVGKLVMVDGYSRVFKDIVAPLVSNRKALLRAMEEVPETGTAVDIFLNTRALKMAGMDEFIDTGSKIENWLSRRSAEFSALSLMPSWNAMQKQFAGVVGQSKFLDDMQLWIDGSIPKKNKAFLLDHFIDEDLSKRILDQFERYGEIDRGVKIPNARSWDDIEARDTFRAGIRKLVDKTVVTPGIDKPLWFDKGVGPIVSQFRSFGFASMQRTLLSGLQQRDMATLNGMSTMFFMGMMVYAAKTAQYGGEVSDDPAKWIIEGADRSGIAGWLVDANNISEKFTRGTVGLNALTDAGPMSRYASRGTLGALGGPTVDLIEKFAQVLGAASTGEITESDIRAIRQLAFYQNHFAARYLFDEAEEGINNAFGIPMREK